MRYLKKPMGLAFMMLLITLPISVLFVLKGGIMILVAIGMLTVSSLIDMVTAKYYEKFDEYQISKIRQFLDLSIIIMPLAISIMSYLLLNSSINVHTIVYSMLAFVWLYYTVTYLLIVLKYKIGGRKE